MMAATFPEALPRTCCRTPSCPSENELSGGQIVSSTSECSSSTCDTSGSHRSSKNTHLGSTRSPLHSIKRSMRSKGHQTVDTKASQIICPNCDAMRLKVTEANTQCYDQWISRIKILEDMLQEKQKINDELQAAFYDQCSLMEHERNVNTALKQEISLQTQAIIQLKQENYGIRDTLCQKDEYIEELSDEIARLRERDKLHNKLKELDRQTIEKLRQACQENTVRKCHRDSEPKQRRTRRRRLNLHHRGKTTRSGTKGTNTKNRKNIGRPKTNMITSPLPVEVQAPDSSIEANHDGTEGASSITVVEDNVESLLRTCNSTTLHKRKPKPRIGRCRKPWGKRGSPSLTTENLVDTEV